MCMFFSCCFLNSLLNLHQDAVPSKQLDFNVTTLFCEDYLLKFIEQNMKCMSCKIGQYIVKGKSKVLH